MTETSVDGEAAEPGEESYRQAPPDPMSFVQEPKLFQVATEIGATPNQVILAWLTGPGIIPTTSASTGEQMSDTLGGADLTLPDEILRRLDAAGAERQ